MSYRDVILSEAFQGGLPSCYYPLTEVNGTTLAERAGDGVALALPGSGFTLGAYRGSVNQSFDPAIQFSAVQQATRAAVNTSSAYTYIFGFFPTATPATITQPIQNGSTNDSYGFSWTHTNGSFAGAAYQQNAGGTFFASQLPSTPALNRWCHVAVTWSGTQLTAYLDGTAGTPVSVSSVRSISGNLLLGMRGNPTTWGLSHFALFTRALSAARILYLAQAFLRGVQPNE